MAKFLVIAEKPSVAQSLAKNLSAYQRKDGCSFIVYNLFYILIYRTKYVE